MGREGVGDSFPRAGDIGLLDGLDRLFAEVVFGFDVGAVDFEDLEESLK